MEPANLPRRLVQCPNCGEELETDRRAPIICVYCRVAMVSVLWSSTTGEQLTWPTGLGLNLPPEKRRAHAPGLQRKDCTR